MTAAAWYLFAEDGQPLGQMIQEGESPFPVIGQRLTDGKDWRVAEVVGFEDLAHICAMRRFRVVIRVLEWA